jgi:hypothetical protein
VLLLLLVLLRKLRGKAGAGHLGAGRKEEEG